MKTAGQQATVADPIPIPTTIFLSEMCNGTGIIDYKGNRCVGCQSSINKVRLKNRTLNANKTIGKKGGDGMLEKLLGELVKANLRRVLNIATTEEFEDLV
jgi:hypothetical protein